MAYPEAVKLLCDDHAIYVPKEVSVPEKKPFVLPTPNDNLNRVRHYLNQRGICDDVIDYCVYLGILYESAPYHNAVLVEKKRAGTMILP